MIFQKLITVKNVWFVIIAFLDNGFKFQDSVCNDCYDLTMLCVNIMLRDIITNKNIDYSCFVHTISKSEAISSLKNFVLEIYGCI